MFAADGLRCREASVAEKILERRIAVIAPAELPAGSLQENSRSARQVDSCSRAKVTCTDEALVAAAQRDQALGQHGDLDRGVIGIPADRAGAARSPA